MSRLPLLGVGCPESEPDSLPIPGTEADVTSRDDAPEGCAREVACTGGFRIIVRESHRREICETGTLNCRWATELDDVNTKNLLGSLEVSKIGEPAVITQVVIFFGGGIPGGVSRLKQPLVLEGIDRVEVQFSQRFRNNEPKKFYGM